MVEHSSVKEAQECSKRLVGIEKNLAEVWRANQFDLLVDQCFAREMSEKFAANALTFVSNRIHVSLVAE